MAAAKIRVSDIAKRMGKSEKDVIFQLQSLGAEITDPSQALEPEVIQALITGKKLSTRTKSVIMREDKPQVAAKKRTIGLVFQDATLLPWKNALENAAFLRMTADETIPKSDALAGSGCRRTDSAASPGPHHLGSERAV